MTRIKRCISVIVLAAFTVMLLAGCNINYAGYCKDISKWINEQFDFTNFFMLADGSTMQTKLWTLAKCYEADLENPYDDNEIESAETNLKQIATLYTSSTELRPGNYYCVLKEWSSWSISAPTENLINLLTAINTWAGENNAIISFKAYEASGDYLFYKDYTFVVGFTVVIIDDDDDDDNEPASSRCSCGGSNCTCDANCSCGENCNIDVDCCCETNGCSGYVVNRD